MKPYHILRLVLPLELKEQVAAVARQKSLSMSAYIRLLLLEELGLDKPKRRK